MKRRGKSVKKVLNAITDMQTKAEVLSALKEADKKFKEEIKGEEKNDRSLANVSDVAVPLYYEDYKPLPSSVNGSSRNNKYLGSPSGSSSKGRTKSWMNNVDRSYMPTSVRTEMPDTELLPELEAKDAKLQADVEMFDHIREIQQITRVPERTLIYAIVVDKKGKDNKPVAIRCFDGVAFGGYARDVSGDAYYVECCESAHLGTIPFSLKVKVPGTGSWSTHLPIPAKVLNQVFAPQQRKTLADLRERYPQDGYEIQFLQMLLAN